MSSRKKQEENHLKILKELLAQPANKKCLECDQRGPTYVDVTIGSFVCTSCGGLLRGLNPPHRVKSISMTTFTSAEISFIESRGNEWCRAVYLAKYDEQSRAKPESRNDHQKLKQFMELKYEQKRWYESPSQQRKLMANAAEAAKKSRASTTPPVAKPLNTLLGNNINNVQIPSAKADILKGITHSRINKPSADLLSDLNPPPASSSNSVDAFGMPTNQTTSNASGFADGFADFDSAFGGFTGASGPAPAPAPVKQPDAFAAFGSISADPIPFTNNTGGSSSSGGSQNASKGPTSSADKYAALADLFNTETKPESNGFSWASPAKSVFPSNQMTSSSQSQTLFGASPQNQNSLFNSAPAPTMNAAPVASSTSWMGSSAAPTSWSSSSNQWNPSGNNWQPTYQQTPTNQPVAPPSNPFFTPGTTQQQNMFGQQQAPAATDFGPFTQTAGPPPTAYGHNSAMMQQNNPGLMMQQHNAAMMQQQNATMMSSTNPFAVGGAMPAANQGFPQQQNMQPMINNPSNPFRF